MSTNARVSDMCRLHIDTPAAFVGARALTKCKPFLKDYGNLKKSLVSLLILYYHICIIKNGGNRKNEKCNKVHNRRIEDDQYFGGGVFTMFLIGNKIFRRDSTAGSYGDGSIFCIEVYGWFCVWYHRLAIKCAGA